MFFFFFSSLLKTRGWDELGFSIRIEKHKKWVARGSKRVKSGAPLDPVDPRYVLLLLLLFFSSFSSSSSSSSSSIGDLGLYKKQP